MKNVRTRFVSSLLACAVASASLGLNAWADAPKISNAAGKIVHFNRSTGQLHLLLERGTTWIIQMEPNSKYEKMKRPCNSSAFKEGEMVSVGIAGSLAETPKRAVLMVDWGSSADYVAKVAAAPYETRKGDFQGIGGAATRSNVGAQAADHTVGILGNGGTLPTHTIQSGNGGTQSVTPSPAGQLPQGLNQISPIRSTQSPQMLPLQNMQQMGIDPFTPQMGATSMFGTDEEGAGGGNQAPQGQMAAQQQGSPIQMTATVLQCNPGGHMMVVRQEGSQSSINVMVNAQVNLGGVRQGQKVVVIGTSNPAGYVDANQVVNVGP